MRDQHAGEEMANYLALISGATPNPEAVTLSIATCSFEPMCFLTARETAPNGIPTIELIHSIGNYVAALGQPDNLHGHSFAFVGETVGLVQPRASHFVTFGMCVARRIRRIST